ncbi:alpha/beta fold hydrolase [Nonomuraea wenchangensis]|uniref:alpha/beta fold hydrolase n=1 Tax=Nonomuraea wenchangensis TaxID=568860 RepID=UPI003421CEDD
MRLRGARSGREYADMLPNAAFRTIDSSGHDITHDQPARYRELVTSFLRGRISP